MTVFGRGEARPHLGRLQESLLHLFEGHHQGAIIQPAIPIRIDSL
jgi:hypothetical protein